MNKAVQELKLSWNSPEEPAKSKLDTWYFRSSLRQVVTFLKTFNTFNLFAHTLQFV